MRAAPRDQGFLRGDTSHVIFGRYSKTEIDTQLRVAAHGINCISGGGIAKSDLPIPQAQKVRRSEDCKGDTQRPHQLCFVAKSEATGIGVKAVGSNDMVEAARSCSLKSGRDASLVIPYVSNGLIVEIRHAGLAGTQQKIGEIVAQNFNVTAIKSTGADRALLASQYLCSIDPSTCPLNECARRGRGQVRLHRYATFLIERF
jgi:hypothetical protein